LPVAAGIGGGSADAAAVIRAVRRANAELEARVDWYAIARRLGADVPVCVLNRAAIMRGIGGKLEPIAALPPLPAVLVNPMVPVPAGKTAEVFRRLAAPPLRKTVTQETPAATPGSFTSRDDLMRFLRSVGNDLTGPATSVVPEIGGVLAALEEAPGALLARLSGAGPTCFAVFETPEAAQAAATRIKSAHPTWWAATVVLQ
jgi:4-diphosphocytidyl-2-C-methyl-D-erythritol kinase